MDASLPPVRPGDPRPSPCKICASPTMLFGVQDFNRNCLESAGRVLPLVGVPIYYRRCDTCGLLFSDAFDDWPDEAFSRHIYNDDYLSIDPDFETARPASNAAMIIQAMKSQAAGLRVLDYGGGNGSFARELAKEGFPDPQTYDRFYPTHRDRPDARFDVVTCFETIEHMPDPVAGAADLVSFLKEDGLLIISTLIQPAEILRERMGWWYAGARNGHVTLFTYPALARLFGRFGLKVYPTNNPAFHFLCRAIPPFAQRFMANAKPIELVRSENARNEAGA